MRDVPTTAKNVTGLVEEYEDLTDRFGGQICALADLEGLTGDYMDYDSDEPVAETVRELRAAIAVEGKRIDLLFKDKQGPVPVESVKRALSPLLGAGKGDVDVTE